MVDQDISKQFVKLRNTFRKELRESVNDIRLDALYQQLLMQHVFDRPEPLAAMTSWSIAPEFAWWLFKYVSNQQPRKIVELGSGTSTLVIAAVLKQLGKGKFISFEHDYDYYKKTEDLLRRCDLQNYVNLVFSPLQRYELEEQTYHWYDLPFDMLNHVVGQRQLDLLLVDGPPASTNRHARYPAYFLLEPYCSNETLIILDDAGREEEQQILQRWNASKQDAFEIQLLRDIRHAPALFYRKKSIALNPPEPAMNANAVTEIIDREVGRLVSQGFLEEARLEDVKLSLAPLGDAYFSMRERSIIDIKLRAAEETQELYERIKQGDGRVLDLNTRLLCAEERETKFLYQIEQKKKELDLLRSAHEKALEDINRFQKKSLTALRNYKRDLLNAYAKEKQIRSLLAFQLGTAIVKQSRTPLGWVKMPLALFRVIVRYKRKKKGVSRSGKDEVDIDKGSIGSRKMQVVRKIDKNKQKNTLWNACHIARDQSWMEGISYAEKNALDYERPAIHLLKANAAVEDDAAWLREVNAYLEYFGLAPVGLQSGVRSKFFRLDADPRSIVESGPLVSVIMPAFNAERTLELAARSILKQSWHRLELIIVDDFSTDNTLTIAESLAIEDDRVKVLHNPANVGPYVSKNLALRISTGDYITGHDADDWAHPERITKHMQAIFAEKKPPKASLAGMIRVNEAGVVTRFSKLGPNTQDGVMSSAFISCMFEAIFLKEVLGGWEEVKFAGDSELIKRAETILGREVIRFNYLSMICLDEQGSLTNDPEHGYSPMSGLSESRLAFRNAFSLWHKESPNGDLFLPFPQARRILDLPSAVRVPIASINKVVAHHDENYGAKRYVCDVCIVTDLRFAGGNASSTLDEIQFFGSQGMDVRLVHCPSLVSQGKRISDRYTQWSHLVEYFHAVTSIKARYLIIRHPAVVCSTSFEVLAHKLSADSVVVVVNNSVVRTDGRAVYSFKSLADRVKSLNAVDVKVFPLSPAVREELQGNLDGNLLADIDWSPTFDASQFTFFPKKDISKPYVLGRHGRDGEEKWIESKVEMGLVYPEDSLFQIKILGGAANAYKIIGYKPANWSVAHFGKVPPEKYLIDIDFFVYFPHTKLNEAFGRTIIEAVFAGVPCILPTRFQETFADLAFYCEPKNVRLVVARLAESPVNRLIFLSAAREFAVAKYETGVLLDRIDGDGHALKNVLNLDGSLLKYKKWVETGEGCHFE